MIKRGIAGLALALSFSLPYQAGADSGAINGLLLGAGSGALIGQAVGRNTKGTLAGAAVGAVLGYAIGNEVDKEGVYRPVSQATVYQQPRMVVVRPESQEVCREAEVLATIDGRAETLHGTACWQDGEWLMVTDQPPPPFFITRTVMIREQGHRRHGHRHHRDRRWDGHGREDHERRVIYRAER